MTLKKLMMVFVWALLLLSWQACQRREASVEPEGQRAEDKGNAGAGLPAGGTVPVGEAKYFLGHVGESRIEMRLVRDGERLSGTYAYLKVGSNLDLRGTVDRQGVVSLKEFDGSGTQTGLFGGQWSEPETETGAVIEGEWSRPDGSKKTSFYIVEQQAAFSGGLKLVTKQIKDDNKQRKYSIDAEYPQIEGSSDANILKFNREVSSFVTKEVDEWKQTAGRDPGEEDVSPEAGDDSMDVGYTARLATDELVSITFDLSFYEHGAAHPSGYSKTVNYDLKQGRALKLADLFKPGASYLQAISAYSIRDLKRQARKENPDDPLLPDDSIEEGAAPTADNYQSWNITRKGLMVNFDSYQVGPYAAGPQKVIIPYAALKEIIEPAGPLAPVLK